MHNTGTSLRKTAAHFNIPSLRTVSQWERIYDEQGKETLFEGQKGRTSKMGTKRPRKPKINIETNEDLLSEVQRLRMENEYLKKIKCLFCVLLGIQFHQNNPRTIITAMHIGTIGFLLLTDGGIYIPFAHNTNNSKIANIKNYNTRPKLTS